MRNEKTLEYKKRLMKHPRMDSPITETTSWVPQKYGISHRVNP